MGELLSDATQFQCPFCSSPLKLCTPASSAAGDSKVLANTTNSFFPPPGGMCSLTQSPCTPVAAVINPGQTPVQIDGQSALGADCKFSCAKGGIIENPSSAQSAGNHDSSDPEQDSDPEPDKPPPVKCSLIRQQILGEAKTIAQTKTTYSQSRGLRAGPKSYDCSGLVSKIFEKIGKPFFTYKDKDATPFDVAAILHFARKHPEKFEISELYQKGYKLPTKADWSPGDLIIFLKDDGNVSNGDPQKLKGNFNNHIGVLSQIDSAPEKSLIISALNHHYADEYHPVFVPSVRPCPIRVLPKPDVPKEYTDHGKIVKVVFYTHAFYVLRFIDCVPDSD